MTSRDHAPPLSRGIPAARNFRLRNTAESRKVIEPMDFVYREEPLSGFSADEAQFGGRGACSDGRKASGGERISLSATARRSS